MSETPETTAPSTAPSAPVEPKPYWLYRLAAWVAIVAGAVFIVSSVFVAGVWASGGMRGHCHHGHHGPHHGAMFHPGHHRGPGPMMRGGPDGPGWPDGPGPDEVPPSVTQPPARTPGR